MNYTLLERICIVLYTLIFTQLSTFINIHFVKIIIYHVTEVGHGSV